MTKYTVALFRTQCLQIEVEADTLQDAVEQVQNAESIATLLPEGAEWGEPAYEIDDYTYDLPQPDDED